MTKTELRIHDNNSKAYETLDLSTLTRKYENASVNGSVLKYCEAVINFCSDAREMITCFMISQADTYEEFSKINSNLALIYKENSSFYAYENNVINERREFFRSLFPVNMLTVHNNRFSMAAEPLNNFESHARRIISMIEKAEGSEDPLTELAKIENTERVSFELIAELTERSFRSAAAEFLNYCRNKHHFQWAVRESEYWTNEYIKFLSSPPDYYSSLYKDELISELTVSDWKNEWHRLRYKIENTVLYVLKAEINRKIRLLRQSEVSVSEMILFELLNYRTTVDSYYINSRKNTYLNNYDCSHRPLINIFEAQQQISAFSDPFRRAVSNIIFKCSDINDRLNILNIFSDLITSPVQVSISAIEELEIVMLPDEKDKIYDYVHKRLCQMSKCTFELFLDNQRAFEKKLEEYFAEMAELLTQAVKVLY